MNIKERIEKILRGNVRSRDNDTALYMLVVEQFTSPYRMFAEVMHDVDRGKVPDMVTVRRTRQSLQLHYPELRGEMWVKRHKLGEDRRMEIREDHHA